MTLLCGYHHRKLHEGGFGVVREIDDRLRFTTDEGRTIPRCGYRLEDFVDEEPSREGLCTATVQHEWERDEVREVAPVYRLHRSASMAMR